MSTPLTRRLFVSGLAALSPVIALAATGTDGKPLQIVALGDSLTAGFGLPPEDGFTTQLQQQLDRLGMNADVVNAGVSGDTSKGGLARVDWSVPDGADLVILELGANDALRGISPDQTEKNLDAIITRLKHRGIEVLLAGMQAPPNMGQEFEAAFNAIFPALAERHDIPFYPFFLEGVAADPQLNQADGMHPNAAGARLIASRIAAAVKRAIGQDG
jgi:acyl-CoA thioesterase-1